jgi:hypothetical protein
MEGLAASLFFETEGRKERKGEEVLDLWEEWVASPSMGILKCDVGAPFLLISG